MSEDVAIPNPYQLNDHRLFYGREALVRRILKFEQQGQSVVIIGGRRMGKTRLLHRICDFLDDVHLYKGIRASQWTQLISDADPQLAPPETILQLTHLPVYINLQGLGEPARIYDHVFVAIEAKLKSVLPSGHNAIGRRPASLSRAAFANRVEVTVDVLTDQTACGGVALFIDEIDALMTPKRDAFAHCCDFLSLLRALVDGDRPGKRLFFCLTGGTGLYDFRHDDGSPALNISRREFLSGIDRPARRRFILSHFRQSAIGRFIDPIIGVAGGHVWLLKNVLYALFEQMRAGAPIDQMAIARAIDDYWEHHQDIVTWVRDLEQIGPGAVQPNPVWSVANRARKCGALDASWLRQQPDPVRRAVTLLGCHAFLKRDRDGSYRPDGDLLFNWLARNGKLEAPVVEHLSCTDVVSRAETDPCGDNPKVGVKFTRQGSTDLRLREYEQIKREIPTGCELYIDFIAPSANKERFAGAKRIGQGAECILCELTAAEACAAIDLIENIGRSTHPNNCRRLRALNTLGTLETRKKAIRNARRKLDFNVSGCWRSIQTDTRGEKEETEYVFNPPPDMAYIVLLPMQG